MFPRSQKPLRLFFFHKSKKEQNAITMTEHSFGEQLLTQQKNWILLKILRKYLNCNKNKGQLLISTP